MERRKNHMDVWKATWIDHYFDRPLWERAFLIGFLAALLGVTLDKAVHALGNPWMFERLVENALEGIVIGVIVYWLGRLRENGLNAA